MSRKGSNSIRTIVFSFLFFYCAQARATTPTITSLSPTAGAVGASVTITGTNFGAMQGTSTVKFNLTTGAPTTWSDTSIVVNVPTGTTTGNVVVKVGFTSSNGVSFTVLPTPSISSLSPTSGAAGTPVTITGTNFGSTQGTGTVAFNGTPATVMVWGAASIAVTVPSGATTGNVIVYASGVNTNGKMFTVVPTPTITNLSPTSGPIGTPVTITGTNFGTAQGTSTVTFNGTPAAAAPWNATSIVAQVPTGATTGNVVVTVSGVASNGSSFTVGTGAVAYIYDELGRLVGVIDPSGNAAGYSYDAVGNITSITRSTASQVSILQFTPKSGPVGTVVTISGTGFSATPSQNTVKFNGTAATVTSSTANQIVTSVPSGTTTGTISVTSPAGSATSSTVFTLTNGSPGPPTISSFTPSIGLAGAAVSITGTNFDPSPINDRTKFNFTSSFASAATSTTATTAVSNGATSGHITMTTPLGSGVSSADFFVPPSPHVAADVVFTGRMSLGQALAVPINTAGKIGLIVFDGTAAQRMSINITNVTIPGQTTVTVYNPDGTTLSSTSANTASGGFLDAQVFPQTGTYTIMVSPTGTNTGSLTLNLYGFTDFAATIAANGQPLTATTTIPGQNAAVTFTGSVNQKVALNINSVSFSGTTNLTIYKPDGSTLVSQQPFFSPGGIFVDTQTLPLAGTYTIYIDPQATNTGSATLTLYNDIDVTGTITPSATGGSASVTITTPGQNAELTFSDTSGQKITLTTSTLTTGSTTISILNPDGSTFYTANVGASGLVFNGLTLTQTGTYTLVINPSGSNTGSVTPVVYNVPSDFTSTITPGGSSVTVTTSPYQNASLTFSGTTNQLVSMIISNDTISSAYLTLYNPDGSTVFSQVLVNTSGYFMDTTSLSQTGTYKFYFAPNNGVSGSATFTLYNIVNTTGSVTVNGFGVRVTLSTPGQNGKLTFSGTANQLVTVHVATNTTGGVTVALLNTTGGTMTSSSFSGASGTLAQQTLPTAGTYTVSIIHSGTNTGSLTISVTSP